MQNVYCNLCVSLFPFPQLSSQSIDISHEPAANRYELRCIWDTLDDHLAPHVKIQSRKSSHNERNKRAHLAKLFSQRKWRLTNGNEANRAKLISRSHRVNEILFFSRASLPYITHTHTYNCYARNTRRRPSQTSSKWTRAPELRKGIPLNINEGTSDTITKFIIDNDNKYT